MILRKWWSSLKDVKPVWKYHLDYPSLEHGYLKDNAGWVIQGWVLINPKVYARLDAVSKPYLCIKINENLLRHVPLDKARLDVIETMLPRQSKKTTHSQLLCGFSCSLPVIQGRFPLTLHVANQSFLLAELDFLSTTVDHAEPALLRVLQGKDNWLFLDNDTNFSVDQHRGYLQLSDFCIDQWQLYIQSWQQQMQPFGQRALFLVAPTKESVLSQYHPYPAAPVNLLDTLFELMPQQMYAYPVQELQALGEDAYYKTDTHWTHKGAQQTVALVAKRFGLAENSVDQIFTNDHYQTKNHAGDLGNKLTPIKKQSAPFLVGFSYRKWVVYDNALPNFGRVLLIEYEPALVDATCLVFGSSSSYSMFSFLCRVFKRVVFAHTAGQLDTTFLQGVKPDYVLAQTNARFMVRPPSADYDLLSMVREKSHNLSKEQKETLTVISNPKKQSLIEQLGLHQYTPTL